MTIWVLKIDHKYGDDVSLFRHKDSAIKELAEYVHHWWSDVVDDRPIPSDNQEAIDVYFESTEREFWSLHSALLND